MERKVYKLNINQFTNLCVNNNEYIQLFTPKEIGKSTGLIPIEWDMKGYKAENVEIGDNIQLNNEEHNIIVING